LLKALIKRTERVVRRKKEEFNRAAIQKAIMIFGSMEALAREINSTLGSVSNWKHGKVVPKEEFCAAIEKATKGQVKREEIRPNFDWKGYKDLMS
jgi:DNA-binding transcriptional regulator YdaS (Cro superfamily)